MKTITFITGNIGKYEEVSALIPNVVQKKIDLTEIQSLDVREISEYKLKEAQKYVDGPILIDDTSLVFEGMNGLPGPLVKWFEDTVKPEGMWKIAQGMGSTKATAIVTLGYANGDTYHFFEGVIEGTLCAPRGTNGIGWDSIFVPEGHKRSFGEMTREEKNAISHRGRAVVKLKEFLQCENA